MLLIQFPLIVEYALDKRILRTGRSCGTRQRTLIAASFRT